MSDTRIVRIIPSAALDFSAVRAVVQALDSAEPGSIVLLGDDHATGQNAVSLAAWLAAQTERVRIVAETPVTHTEPFHVATSTATLDYVSRGRAGWSPTAQTDEATAALTGRREAAGYEAWKETGDVARIVRELWTSWDGDAEIRDEETHRFVDREKLHYIDAGATDSVGETYTVKGPSIVPRPPQGELPVVVTVGDPECVAVVDSALKNPQDILVVGDRFVSRDGDRGEVVELHDTSELLTFASQVAA